MKGVDSRVVTRARLTSRSGSELDRERWVAFGCVGVPLIKRMCIVKYGMVYGVSVGAT